MISLYIPKIRFQKLFHRINKNTPNFPYFTNDFQNNEKCEKNAPPRR